MDTSLAAAIWDLTCILMCILLRFFAAGCMAVPVQHQFNWQAAFHHTNQQASAGKHNGKQERRLQVPLVPPCFTFHAVNWFTFAVPRLCLVTETQRLQQRNAVVHAAG
jgi:hypothetical protein